MTALQVGTVFACVNVISDGVSSLPLHVYQRSEIGGRSSKTLAVNSPLYDLVHLEPNPEMTSSVFFKVAMVHALLWGNTYSEIQKNNSGQVVAIWPRNPARTRPIRILKPITFEGDLLPAGTLMYETSDQMMDSSSFTVDQNPEMMNVGMKRLVLAENMLHIPGLSLDGRLGQSTVWLARQAFGLALATEKYGAKFFGNGARPAGILTLPNKLEDKAIETLRRSWAEAHGGENQFKVAVLEQGVKYEKIAATPEEGQMLQTRKYEREEICAIFGVPAHMVAASDKSGKSNVEQSSIEFVLYCLHPWLNRFEQEFARKLFPSMGRTAGKYFVKFDTRKLMYPDAAARSAFYSQGKQWGFLNTNMILELEDMNPIDNPKVGETFWQPINMQDAGDPQKLGAEDQNQLDIEKQTQVAEHAAQMQQDTAKVTTNLQMKAAEQAHGHAMDAATQSSKHAQAMGKMGLTASGNKPGAGDAQPAAPGARPDAGTEPTPPAGGGKTTKRFSKAADTKRAMQQAMEDGFIFTKTLNQKDGTVYRYIHPDRRELNIAYSPNQKPAPAETSVVASGTDRDNMMELYRNGKGPAGDGSTVLYALRHGTTNLNQDDKFRGWVDVDLDDKGIQDANGAAAFLKDKGIKEIYCSDLKRAVHTAEIVGGVLGLKPTPDPRLRPWNIGELSGKSKKDHQKELEHYIDNPTEKIPGGESLDEFSKRSQDVDNEYLDKFKASGPGLLVFHTSNVIQLENNTKEELHARPESDETVKPGGVIAVTVKGDKLDSEAVLKDNGPASYGS